MKKIDAEIASMTRQLRQVGAAVNIDEDASDTIKQAFLDMIHDCPDCQEALKKLDQKTGRLP